MSEKTVTLSRSAYVDLLDRIEDLEASVALIQARLADDGTRIPLMVVKEELAGAHPVRAWRTYRGLTVEELASKAGINAGRLTEIETGSDPGSADAYYLLADALAVSADVLVPERAEASSGK